MFLPPLSENEIPEFGIIKITVNNFKTNTFKEAWAGISMSIRCFIWRHTFSYISITPPVRKSIIHWWWVKRLPLMFTTPFYLTTWKSSTSGLLDCWSPVSQKSLWPRGLRAGQGLDTHPGAGHYRVGHGDREAAKLQLLAPRQISSAVVRQQVQWSWSCLQKDLSCALKLY